MSSNEQQPFRYTVQCVGLDGSVSTNFGYIDQQGTTVVSMGVPLVWDEDGMWVDPMDTDMSVSRFGEAGSLLVIESGPPIGIMATICTLSLAFKTAVDFTKPLPLDQLSLPDSSYQVSRVIPYMETTYAVMELTPSPMA